MGAGDDNRLFLHKAGVKMKEFAVPQKFAVFGLAFIGRAAFPAPCRPIAKC